MARPFFLLCVYLLLAMLAPPALGQAPSITQQPSSLTVLAGASAVFSVTATGGSPLGYQWRLNGTNILDATNTSYTVNFATAVVPPQPPDSYDVVVSNASGTITSQAATLTVNVPLDIFSQPKSVTLPPGANVTFSVGVNGTSPISYQWRYNGSPLGTGSTLPSLTVNNVQFSSSGAYDVIVSNTVGSITSQVAVLTVRDFTQPAFAGPLRPVFAQCTGPNGAIVNFSIFVTDIYDPFPTVTYSPPPGSLFPMGITTVTCVAYDHFGNTNVGYLQVEVQGQCDGPCIELNVPQTIYVYLDKAPTIPVYFTPTASNNCTGQPYPVNSTPPSGSAFPLGTTVVTCVASAVGENPVPNTWTSVTKTFNVVVGVTNPPILLLPGNMTICVPPGQVSVVVNYTVQALDQAGLPVNVNSQPASGSTFPLGPTLVSVSASDGYGNATASTFTITVQQATGTDPDWGFEDTCGFGGWIVAFQNAIGLPISMAPVTGDLFLVQNFSSLQGQIQGAIGGDYWNKVFYPIGHKGQRWVCTGDSHVYGLPQQGNINDTISDSILGSLVSVDFVITNDCISFLIGGGKDSANLAVQLLLKDPSGTIPIAGSNYRLVTSATGSGDEVMRREWFSGLINGLALGGSHARIRIYDNSGAGHLNVDDFQFSDTQPNQSTVTLRNPPLKYGGAQFPSVISLNGTWYDWDSAVWGFADLHTHPLSCLGFGQKLFHGSPDGAVFNSLKNPADFTAGLSNCKTNHGGWGFFDNQQGDYWRNAVVQASDGGGDDPHNEGFDSNPFVEFRKWPVFDSITHQQMWFDWIRRAYNGGERVMVALCVNNELLNAVSKGEPGAPIDDATVGDLQIQAVKDFVARHSDFMAIAYDPLQLRNIVRSNKMAVILGSELDDIGNLVQDPNVSPNAPLSDYSKMAVASTVQHLYDEGLRYMFTVHLADNKFGGTGSETAMLNVASKFLNQGASIQVIPASQADNIQNWMDNLVPSQEQLSEITLFTSNLLANAISGNAVDQNGLFFMLGAMSQYEQAMELSGDLNALTGMGASSGAGLMPFIASLLGDQGCPNCLLDQILNFVGVHDLTQFNNANLLPVGNNYPVYPACGQAPFGVRNARGLSALGVYAVQEMMKRGMMLDVDHMSQFAVDDASGIAMNVPGGYPLNSGHNGYREMGTQNSENARSVDQLAVLQQLGGLLGVGWEDSADGFWTASFSDVVPAPQYSSSLVANNCAGTSRTWAQEYLYALEKFHGANVAFGTDADGFIQFPGPRFGPQSAYGLIQSDALCPVLLSNIFTKNVALRTPQIRAQNNGVLYTDPALLTTAAFRGRSSDYSQDPLNGHGNGNVDANSGFTYNGEQTDFYAAINIFFRMGLAVSNGLPESTLENQLNQIAGGLSPNYNIDSLGFNVFDNSHQRRIKEFALGLLKGIGNVNAGDDAGVSWVWPAQTLGIALYDTKVKNSTTLANQALNASDFFDNNGTMALPAQLQMLLPVWDDYLSSFGQNAPLTHCQTDFKEWDINFEGVAHYGLFPDFLQDLHNVGLQPQDMSPLFRSAESFAQMWTKSIAGSVAFGTPQFYYVAPDGHGNMIFSFTHGNYNYVVQQNNNPANQFGWVPANISATISNSVTTTVVVSLGNCNNCATHFRVVASP